MTETKGPCPSHSGDTGGTDSYVWNSEKNQGHCFSCALSTWLHQDTGELWGKRDGRKFLVIPKGGEAFVLDTEEDTFVSPPANRNEGEFKALRGITKETMQHWGVKTYGDTKQVYVYPSGGTKTRYLKEKGFSTEHFKSDELFGMNMFPSGCSKIVTITEGECFTPDAEVFTPAGWVALRDYTGQPVLQVYPDQSAGFTNPLAVVSKPFKGALVEYVSGSYYSLTTPAHNLVREHPKEGLKKYKANVNSWFNIPRVFTRRDTHADLTTLELQIWIMLSADFTFRASGDIYGAFKKLRKVERAKHLLDQHGVRYVVNKNEEGYYSFFIHRRHNLWFTQKDLPFCLSWHPDKEKLLEEVIFWDGNYVKTRNQAEFSTIRKHNADVVQMLAHSCGYVSSIIHRSNEHGGWMKVSILFGKTNSSTQKGYNSVPYDGQVMCLTVETGMLVVRQKGSVSISGNCDAMSAWQMLKSGNYINPVVSLPSATPAGKLWEKCKTWLDSFEKIILSADNDDPGRKVAETLFDLYPGKVYLMDHGTYKDANDFLMNGDAQAYKSAWWSAKKYSPAGFTASVEDWLSCLSDEEPYKYVPTPFEDYNKVARGLVKGGITILKAPPGSGKSSLLRCLQHDQVTNRGCKVAALMMEEVKSITGRAMASYQLGKNVMTKEDAEWAGISEDEVKEALKTVIGDERFISFDINPQDPIKDTLRQCKQAVAFYDVDYIYIDHLQRLAYLSGTEGATSALTELAVQLTEFAKRKDVGIICISHVNQDGSVKYAKSVEEEAIVVIELERDRQSDDFEERNTAYLTVTKNRPFGTTGSSGALTYDVETTILREKSKPKEPKVANTQEF